MEAKRVLLLADLSPGCSGRVVRIDGGRGIQQRLEAMGVYPGVQIRKKSALFGYGPSIVAVAGSELAIGYGKARRIWVEVEEVEDPSGR
ncbi:MAG: ferrous iron transport protein A [Firmicutes bacterium]|jgi:ferrous iron transport protein A|nr:ferrous iron transport protein A [Bacillota bacterium]